MIQLHVIFACFIFIFTLQAIDPLTVVNFNFHLQAHQTNSSISSITAQLTHSNADIITLQGIYSLHHQRYIYNELKHKFPYYNTEYESLIKANSLHARNSIAKTQYSSVRAPCYYNFNKLKEKQITSSFNSFRKKSNFLLRCIQKYCSINQTTASTTSNYYCALKFCSTFNAIYNPISATNIEFSRECYYCILLNSFSNQNSNICYNYDYNNELYNNNNNNNNMEFYRSGLLILSRHYLLNNKFVTFNKLMYYYLKGFLLSQVVLQRDGILVAATIISTSITSVIEENEQILSKYNLDPIKIVQRHQLQLLNNTINYVNNNKVAISNVNKFNQQARSKVRSVSRVTNSIVVLAGAFNFGVGYNQKRLSPILQSNYLYTINYLKWNDNNGATKFCTYCKSALAPLTSHESNLLISTPYYSQSNIKVDHIFTVTSNNNTDVSKQWIVQATPITNINVFLPSIDLLLTTYVGTKLITTFTTTDNELQIDLSEESNSSYASEAFFILLASISCWCIIILIFFILCCCSSTKAKLLQPVQEDVTLRVSKLNVASADKFHILHDVAFVAKPGEMVAIMGYVISSLGCNMVLISCSPSGSGKSTLLNVLCGDATAYNFSGQISVNGNAVTDSLIFNNKCCFVTQNNHFISHLTVFEALLFAADFQLPRLNRKQKIAKVNNVLNMLQLSHVRNELVTNYGGLSGGQKRRVMLGIDGLIADVKLLFLDEVTTGLSSQDALDITNVLRDLATNHNYTIIVTIHQPSKQIFEMFDNVLLINDGKSIYFGSTNSSSVANYFTEFVASSSNTSLEINAKENIANTMIDILQNSAVAAKLHEFWESSDSYRSLQNYSSTTKSTTATQLMKPFSVASFLFVLCAQIIFEIYTWANIMLRIFYRRKGIIWQNLAFEVIRMSYNSWLMFQTFSDDTVNDAYIANSLVGILIVLVMDISLLPSWTAFYCDLAKLMKYEMSRARYSLVTHNIVIPGALIARSILITGLSLSFAYWAVGLTASAYAFFFTLGIRIYYDTLLSLTTLFACFYTEDPVQSLLLGFTICMVNFLSMGFYVHRETMTSFTRWLNTVCVQTYILEALAYCHFDDKQIECHEAAGTYSDATVKRVADELDLDNCKMSGSYYLQGRGLKDRLTLDYAVMLLYASVFFLLFVGTTLAFFVMMYFKVKYAYAPSSKRIVTRSRPSSQQNVNTITIKEKLTLKAKNTLSNTARINMIDYSNIIKTKQSTEQNLSSVQHAEIEDAVDAQAATFVSKQVESRNRKAVTVLNVVKLSYAVSSGNAWQQLVSGCSAQKQILHKVSLTARKGEFVGILGPSGSGKTSFLELVAGVKRAKITAQATGSIYCYDKLVTRSLVGSELASYVEQFPFLPEEFTVSQFLAYAACLQLPLLSRKKRLLLVNNVAKLLKISHIMQLPIGTEDNSCLSGGQRQRVAIAAQCLLRPSKLMLMDEPTSGLSAADSIDICLILRHLVKYCDYTVILTIHQPRAAIFSMFDRIVLFSKGEAIFSGSPAAAEELVAKFITTTETAIQDDNIGNNQHSITSFNNTAEALLQLASDDSSVAEIKEEALMEVASEPTKATSADVVNYQSTALIYLKRFVYICYYSALLLWKNFSDIGSILSQIFAVSLLAGLVGFQVGDDTDSLKVFGLIGLIFFITINVANAAAHLFFMQARHLQRQTSEMLKNYYSPFQYLVTFTLQVNLVIAPASLVAGLIALSMVGFRFTATNITLCIFSMFLLIISIYFLGLVCLMMWEDITRTIAAIGYIISFSLVSSSFFVQYSIMPKSATWIKYISPVALASEVIMSSEVEGQSYDCDTDPLATLINAITFTGCPLTGDNILEQFDANSNGLLLTVITNFSVLFAISFLCFTASYIILSLRLARIVVVK